MHLPLTPRQRRLSAKDPAAAFCRLIFPCDLLLNGDFEAGSPRHWTVTGGGGEVRAGEGVDGTAAFVSTGPGEVTLAQTIPTLPGQEYTVSFALRPNVEPGEPRNRFTVCWDGVPVFTSCNNDATSFVHHCIRVVASGQHAAISFCGSNARDVWVLDAVSVSLFVTFQGGQGVTN